MFAVHPVHTEAVDWISALPDIGCTIFVLAGFWLFAFVYDGARLFQEGRAQNMRWLSWGISLTCFVLALLWKETAAVVPLLIGVYVLLAARPTIAAIASKRRRSWSLPYWIVLGGYLFVRMQFLGTIAATQLNWQLSPLQLALTLPFLMAKYWWKLIAPFGLNAYHFVAPVTSALQSRAAAAVLFLALTVAFSRLRAPSNTACCVQCCMGVDHVVAGDGHLRSGKKRVLPNGISTCRRWDIACWSPYS